MRAARGGGARVGKVWGVACQGVGGKVSHNLRGILTTKTTTNLKLNAQNATTTKKSLNF